MFIANSGENEATLRRQLLMNICQSKAALLTFKKSLKVSQNPLVNSLLKSLRYPLTLT
jgi:hypothetical protein